MRSSFTANSNVVILFKRFNVQSSFGLGVACFLCALFTIIYEGLKCLRLNLAQKHKQDKRSCFTKAHIIQTILHLLELLLGNLIMLTVMTFNVWLFVAVIIGSTIGLQICSFLSQSHTSAIPDSCINGTKDDISDSCHKPAITPNCHQKNQEQVSVKSCHETLPAEPTSNTCHGGKIGQNNLDHGDPDLDRKDNNSLGSEKGIPTTRCYSQETGNRTTNENSEWGQFLNLNRVDEDKKQYEDLDEGEHLLGNDSSEQIPEKETSEGSELHCGEESILLTSVV